MTQVLSTAIGIGAGLFVLALIIGTTVRAVRAEPGQRLRAAFSHLVQVIDPGPAGNGP